LRSKGQRTPRGEKKLENAQKHNEQLSNALASSTRLRQKLEDEIQEKDMEIEDLLEKVEEMTKALRKGGKVADCELNEQLKERVTAAAKQRIPISHCQICRR